MLKKNISRVIISSVIVLLPMLFGVIMWNALPDALATHFGADGKADGFGGKAFAVFGLPCFYLVLHFVCLLFTLLDKKQRGQNPKALGIVFWIVPVLSLLGNGVMYRTALGREIDFSLFVPALLGAMLIFIGNYLPKVKQNRTLGIKVWWALTNEENWNRTHRLAGKVWVAGGVILLSTLLLPLAATAYVMLSVLAAAVLIPIIYSYCIYRQHRRQGIEYTAPPKSNAERTTLGISVTIAAVILVGVAVLLSTGNIEVECEETSLKIHATYWTDLDIDYSALDTAEYRKGLDMGMRTNGLGSPRLSVGSFQNDEFGAYTLYAYTNAEEFVVLTSEGKTLVIGMSSAEDTQRVYEEVLERMGK